LTRARAVRSFWAMARLGTDNLSAGDWARAALEVLAESGIDAVAVEPLARRLKVTKGSFYWHFRSRAVLLEAALSEWETSATREVIELMEAVADPRERLHRLFREAMPGPPRRRAIELAVSDAASHPIVAPALRRVVQQRIAYLGLCYQRLGFTPEAARHRAVLTYSVYAGALRLIREAPGCFPAGKHLEAYRRHVTRTLLAPTGRTERPTDQRREARARALMPSKMSRRIQPLKGLISVQYTAKRR
jgi:AcrR family transcriptional regulator